MSDWQSVSSSGTRLFDSSLHEIEAILQLIQQAQECVTGVTETAVDVNPNNTGDSSNSASKRDIRSVAQALQTKCGDAKNRVNKDFKSFQTNLAKVTTQIEKSYATADLDTLCKNKLGGSITQLKQPEASENQPPRSSDLVTGIQSKPFVGSEDAESQAAADDTDSLISSFDAILIESWLRDGRLELAQSLQNETNVPAHSTSTSSTPPSSKLSSSPSMVQQAQQFSQMNSMLDQLKRREIDGTLNWVVRQKSSVDAEVERVEAFIQSTITRQQVAVGGIESNVNVTSPSPAAVSTSQVRRRRVNFRDGDGNILFSPSQTISSQQQQQQQQQQLPNQSTDKSSLASPSSSMLSSLRSHVSSLRDFRSSLHRLHFDLHRMKFLQLLMDSEREGKVRRGQAPGTEYAHKRKKRKSSSIRSSDEDDRSRKHVSSEYSDAAPSAHAESSDSDDELNRIAENAQNGSSLDVASAPHPSSFSYHAALQYAQSFFPLFADSRMEDIGRLSGCLLFLGRLTEGKEDEREDDDEQSHSSGLSDHPYRPYFTRAGQSSMWKDVYQRASFLCLIQLNRCALDPFDACLQACDIALPQLSRFEAILKLNRDIMASAESTITDIDLGVRFQFHSTFICPVTKEQCTNAISDEEEARQQAATDTTQASPQPQLSLQSLLPSSIHSPLQSVINGNQTSVPPEANGNNPPVMLTCGHVISLSAMEKIVKGLRATRRFKCPTCPREQTPNEVLVLVL